MSTRQTIIEHYCDETAKHIIQIYSLSVKFSHNYP